MGFLCDDVFFFFSVYIDFVCVWVCFETAVLGLSANIRGAPRGSVAASVGAMNGVLTTAERSGVICDTESISNGECHVAWYCCMSRVA